MKEAGTFRSPNGELRNTMRPVEYQGRERRRAAGDKAALKHLTGFQNATGSWGIGDGGQQHLSNSVGARVVPLEPVIQGTPCCGLDWKARISARWPESPLSPSRWLLCFG